VQMQQPRSSSSLLLQAQECSQVRHCSGCLHTASAAAAPTCTCWRRMQHCSSSRRHIKAARVCIASHLLGPQAALRSREAAVRKHHQQQQRQSRSSTQGSR
jgi:hypothetical protein